MSCKHDMGPHGYIERSEWAEKKLKTHDCKQCPKCHLWVIWVKKPSTKYRVGSQRIPNSYPDEWAEAHKGPKSR